MLKRKLEGPIPRCEVNAMSDQIHAALITVGVIGVFVGIAFIGAGVAKLSGWLQ